MIAAIITLAVLLPVFTIGGFITGYNMNADKKIQPIPKIKKKRVPTETEMLLSRIENATVYKTETNE